MPAATAAQAELLVSAAQPVAPLARLGPTASTLMVEQLAMAATAAQVLQALTERLYFLMVEQAVPAVLEGVVALVEPLVVWEAWLGQTVLAATVALALMVARALVGLRELMARILAKPAAMDFREAKAAMAEPGARLALVPDLPQMALVEMVATGDLPAWPAMEATVQMVTRRPPMAEPVEMAAIPAWLEPGERVDLEPGARMVSMGLLRHPAAMGATAERASRRILLVSQAATAAAAGTAALMATAAMAAQVATACIPRIRACLVPMAEQAATVAREAPCLGTAATAAEAATAVRLSAAAWVRGAIGSAKTRRSVDQVETEGLEAPRFLETLARAALVATVVRAVTVAQDLVQQRPETMVVTVALVHPAALRVPVVQEVLRVQWGLMAQEATAAMEDMQANLATAEMARRAMHRVRTVALVALVAILVSRDPVVRAARQA